VFSEDRAIGRQAADTNSLNELVLEVYLAAWTRAADQDDQRPHRADVVNDDDPGEIVIELDHDRSIRLLWGLGMDFDGGEVDGRRRLFPGGRRDLRLLLDAVRFAELVRLCSVAESVVCVGDVGRRRCDSRMCQPPAAADRGRCDSPCWEPSRDDARGVCRRRHLQHRERSIATQRYGGTCRSASSRRERVGSVCYTSSRYVVTKPTNYRKAG
jgi:hypothetical protein